MDAPLRAWPLYVYFLAVVALLGGFLAASHVLGQRHAERATATPFESGVEPTGTARGRVPARFYLVAVFFVIFDAEAVFLFAWALVVRQAGWVGFAGAVGFMALLGASLLYIVRSGGLDVAPRVRARQQLGAGGA